MIEWLGDLPDGWKVLFDILASVGTLAAAVLAAVTIRQAKKQAKASQDALLLERRVEFQLDLLKELASFNLHSNDFEMRLRAEMLRPDLFPLTRKHLRLESTPEAADFLRRLRAAGQVPVRDESADELQQAISTSLEARSITGVSRRHFWARITRANVV